MRKAARVSRSFGSILVGCLATAPVAHVAYCAIYMSEDQAASQIFPKGKFTAKWLDMTDTEAASIEKLSGENVRDKKVRVYAGADGSAVFIDRVVGKHEFITYAVGLEASGKVKGIEVIEYKETYGHEIRRPEWRAQFTGKDTSATLKLDKDIQNISGATLSSAHITSGVRRVLHSFAVLKPRLR
jgi:Na+-translocating ferredoxin:NAD+ oxidoreductase RnfG subunit